MTQNYSKELEKISKLPPTTQPIVFGALLSRVFHEKGVRFTIVGGAAVQFFTQATYVTKDLDVILVGDTLEVIEEIMGGFGFKRTTNYRHFENPTFGFVVEFPPEPIQVGGSYISHVTVIETEMGPVRIIRIEDIIMDRIIGGVEWNQEHLIAQAKLLWIKNKKIIDRKYLISFAKKEGYLRDLRKIMKL